MMMSLFAKTSTSTVPPDTYGQRSGYFTSPNQLIPTRPPFATAGQVVTKDTALSKVALLAGVNLIAEMPSILDGDVWTGQGGQRRKTDMPSALEDPEGLGYGLVDFAYKYLSCRMLRGNVFIRVDKVNSQGRPSVVTLIPPDDVIVRRNSKGQWEFHASGHAEPLKPFRSQPEGGIIHRRAFPQAGQALGLSVVSNHARTLGLSLASEQFGADFFADGAHPSGILTTDQPVSEPDAKTIKQRFVNAIRGSREPAVLGGGVKYTPIQITPEESQFLETQKWTAAEVCRMVGPGVAEMLGYETGGTMTYQNVNARSLHLLIYTVDRWLKEFEACVSEYFLPRSQELLFDRTGVMRMVPQDRWKVHRDELTLGAKTINEVRAEEGLPPVEWGDTPYLPSFGSTGTAAAEHLQIDAMDEEIDGKLGDIKVKIPAAPKIGGTAS
jgi:HK97 family phage portal protein